MENFNLRTDQRSQGELLVKKYHYSHRIPANVQLCITWHMDGGLFGDFGECVASVFYSIPPTRWSEKVYELSRLVRKDDVKIKLSMLIGESIKFIKKNNLIDLLVSFADSTMNHHGGIYQACSWNYHGKRKQCVDGLIINGKFVPGRTLGSLYGTRSKDKLFKIYNITAYDHFDEGKHLYWKSLNKTGEQKANRLGLQINPYPKPNREVK